jgi:hypothetical protein
MKKDITITISVEDEKFLISENSNEVEESITTNVNKNVVIDNKKKFKEYLKLLNRYNKYREQLSNLRQKTTDLEKQLDTYFN